MPIKFYKISIETGLRANLPVLFGLPDEFNWSVTRTFHAALLQSQRLGDSQDGSMPRKTTDELMPDRLLTDEIDLWTKHAVTFQIHKVRDVMCCRGRAMSPSSHSPRHPYAQRFLDFCLSVRWFKVQKTQVFNWQTILPPSQISDVFSFLNILFDRSPYSKI